MEDVPVKALEHLKGMSIVVTGVHRDYVTDEAISYNLFEKNTHHGKVKGLELCHIDPTIPFCTFAENLTIGTCPSNRMQGGYTLKNSGLQLLAAYMRANPEYTQEEMIKELNERISPQRTGIKT